MKLCQTLSLLAGLCSLALISSPCAADKPEQIKRDAERLSQVKTLALAPPVIQLKFDRNRLPDPGRMAARQAVASRVATMLETPMKSGPYTILPVEGVMLAVKEQQWQPTDLYTTLTSGSWETPCEVLKNKKGDEATLLCKWNDMDKESGAMSLFRYKWGELPDIVFGLATTRSEVFPTIDLEKAKILGEKVGADGLLYIQVGDMEIHKGMTLFENFKSTRLYLQCTLIAPADGAVLWQARVRSIHSHKAGVFTGSGAFQTEMGMAIEAGTDGFKALIDDLLHGTGQPVKQETKP